MTSKGRRNFLKVAASAAAASAGTAGAAVSATPSEGRSGSIMDVDHVVILMQENRSFDHYFGCLKGVRGYDDPRAIALPGGAPVWSQPLTPGSTKTQEPFRLNGRSSSAESIASLDHSWKRSHALWKNHDAWIKTKTVMSMGYFQREDIPFYYALADAFTICDAYHASLFGPTNPNRMFLFSGTSGINVGLHDELAIANPLTEPNETADPRLDGPKFSGFTWTTYAERLQAAGVSWKLYQEYDNFGDNGLAYFKAFRGLDPASTLYQKARAWADGSNAQNAKASRGEHLISAFTKDLATGQLPSVSWIVAPTLLCEHPQAAPSYGEKLTEGLLKALAAHPDVWAKTVFLLNYDENDGFFDHVPPPVPPVAGAAGKGNIDASGEIHQGVPVGLGPRVPMIVVSPWSQGGFVSSEVFDHTSVIRFLEARFDVHEPNITPWRRAVCGDLTSTLDFQNPNLTFPHLPSADHYADRVDLTAKLPPPTPASLTSPPRQEVGQRPARPLPYALHATGVMATDGFRLGLANRGRQGASLQVFAAGAPEGPWFYSLAAGSSLSDVIPLPKGQFDVALHGPGGFFRRWRARGYDAEAAAVALGYDQARDRLFITVVNPGREPIELMLGDGYSPSSTQSLRLKPGEERRVTWPLVQNAHWYDVSVTAKADPAYHRQFAGHVETGANSKTDPLIGRSDGWGKRLFGVRL